MPEVPWVERRCVICLIQEPITLEHIIPNGIGGRLCAQILCKNCNDQFGHRVDATLQKAPTIRLAIAALKQKVPKLYSQIETGQMHVLNLGAQKVTSKMSKLGDLTETSAADGSLIVPERSQTKHISNILKRAGHSNDVIRDALQQAQEAPYGEKVEIVAGIQILKWQSVESSPVLQGTNFPALAALKMSFESLTLGLGSHIYEDFSTLSDVRTALMTLDEQFAMRHIAVHFTEGDYQPFHGIHLKGVDDNIEVQIRLFGKIAILCKFTKISATWLDVVYTQSLGSADFSVRNLFDQSAPKPSS